MKKFFFVLLFGLMTASLAYAQANKVAGQAGKTALNFTLNGFGGFGPGGAYVGATPPNDSFIDSLLSQASEFFGGRFIHPVYGLGMTFYLTDNFGLRLGFGANMESSSTPLRNDTTGKEDTDTRLAAGFSPGVQIHLANSGPVTFYTGVVFSIATNVSWVGPDTAQRAHWQFGYSGGALIGAEFYPFENVSLGAESQLGLEYTTKSRRVGNTTTDGPSVMNIGFALPLRVCLSFHY